MIGRNGRIGPVEVKPSRSAPQPHWNTAVTTPSAAPRLSNDVTAPIKGTNSDRNRIVSAMNPKPTTTARKTGSALESTVVKSVVTAVVPPTYARIVVPCSACGIVSVRSRSSRASVAGSCGEVSGITWIAAMVWFAVTEIGTIASFGMVRATPGVACRSRMRLRSESSSKA